jgi:hypothetical protein
MDPCILRLSKAAIFRSIYFAGWSKNKVILAMVPVRAPQSKMAQGALAELRSAYELFDSAALFGGRAVKMLVCLPFVGPITNITLTLTAHREEASGKGCRKFSCSAYVQRAIRNTKTRWIFSILRDDFHDARRSFHAFAVAWLPRVINAKSSWDASYFFWIDFPIFSTSRATTFIRHTTMEPSASCTHRSVAVFWITDRAFSCG